MARMYQVQGRTGGYSGGWHPAIFGGPECTTFATHADAQAAIDQRGGKSEDFRIVEIDAQRYQAVAYCRDVDCRCDDQRGIILYDGPDHAAAVAAMDMAPRGYVVEIEVV